MNRPSSSLPNQPDGVLLPPPPKRPVYLDYAATTPVAFDVAEAMHACLTAEGVFGNPASRSHWHGWQADEIVESARTQLADLIGCSPLELIWTSGATEANNLAIKGLLEANPGGRHVITSAIEHKAVLDVVGYLEAHAGYSVTRLVPDQSGCILADQVAAALRPDTALISLMHVNNEIGVILPLAEVSALAAEANVVLHVDGAQSLGKIPIDLAATQVDLMSFSGHKTYGPKGVGALYVRRGSGLRLAMQIHGGGHERGLRSGTLATHQIAGMGAAAAAVGDTAAIEVERRRLEALRRRFCDAICGALPNCHPNGALQQCFPGILNLTFPGTDSDTLLRALNPYASVSSGSACTSLSVEPSHVLMAMGLSRDLAHASLRFSFGRPTTTTEVDAVACALLAIVTRLG